MRISILCLLVLFPYVGTCQDREIGLGVSVFPNVSNGFASSGDTNSFYYSGINSVAFSYSAGFEVDFYLNNGWGISSGLMFQKVGDRSKSFPPDPSRGLIFERKYVHKHYYLELPIECFKIFNEKWILNIGVSPLLNLWHRGLLFTGGGDGIKLDAQTYASGKFGFTTNLGVGYHLNFQGASIKFLPYTQFNFIKPLENIPSIDVLPSRYYATFGLRVSYLILM